MNAFLLERLRFKYKQSFLVEMLIDLTYIDLILLLNESNGKDQMNSKKMYDAKF